METKGCDDEKEDSGSKFDAKSQPEDLVAEFREFVFGTSCSREMRAFCEKHAREVDLASVDGEHALAHTELHQLFTAFFERRIADWLADRGYSQDELSQALRHIHIRSEAKGDEDSEQVLFVASLLAIFDFEAFMVLMRETKRGTPWDMQSMFEQ